MSRRSQEAPREATPATGRFDPAVGIAVVLAGCFLTFYLVGLPLIPLGAWMLARSGPAPE